MFPHRRWAPLLTVLVTACNQEPLTGTPFLLGNALASTTAELGGPLPLLTPYEQRLFARGSVAFQTVFTPATGLGPLFNSTACAGCHEEPVAGGTGSADPEEAGEDVEIHATAYRGGVCDELSDKGGPVFQKQATPPLQALGIDHEPVPLEATATAQRTTPSVLGFGLLDAVPDAEILARADPDDRDGDGISGRPNVTADGRIGRFGRKAQVPTLRDFVAQAFVLEMGITNPAFPAEQTVGGMPLPAGVDPTADPELTQEALDAAVAFSQLLAPPAPVGNPVIRMGGQQIFSRIGCDGCHVPRLRTGDNPVRALRYKYVEAYTDLLLHDMGPDLADICLGQASPSEFRTEPLMGLRFKATFLHDGRAASIEEAIRLHAGEAAGARDRFLALSERQRGVLLRFLGGL
jgi:CxxC motif-containing protein (DUF1111 family)